MSERNLGIQERANNFFEKREFTKRLEEFFQMERCQSIVAKAFDDLLELYNKMIEEFKDSEFIVERIKNQVYRYNEEGRDVFFSDIFENFKMNFYLSIIQEASDVVTNQTLEEILTDDDYKETLEFIQGICDEMLKVIPQKFMESVRAAMFMDAFEKGHMDISFGTLDPESGKIELHSLRDMMEKWKEAEKSDDEENSDAANPDQK